MLHKSLFILAHTLKYRDFMECYKFVKKNEYESYENLKRYQEEKLQRLIQFSYDKVPYYHKLFKSLNLKPEDIRSIEDLQKLPILTKEIIRNNQKDFIPLDLKDQKYANRSTAGSTGHPLQYRNSNDDKSLGFAILYANWGYAGYELGDKVAIIAGSSLIPSTGSKLIDNIKTFVMNTKNFSAFDLNEKFPFKDKTFDYIIANQVIEHLYFTDHFIEEIHRLLKTGGVVILSSTNLAAIHSRIILLLGYMPNSLHPSRNIVGTLIKKQGGNPLYGHKSVFTGKALKQFVKVHKFKILLYETQSIILTPDFLSKILCKVFDWGTHVNIVAKK